MKLMVVYITVARDFVEFFRHRRRLFVLHHQHPGDRRGDGGNRRRRLVLRLHPGHQGFRNRGGFRRPRHQHPR